MTNNYWMGSNIHLKDCSQKTVIYVECIIFCLKFTQHATWMQTESNQEVTKNDWLSTLQSTENLCVWARTKMCVMYKLPKQQYSQIVSTSWAKMPFLFSQVIFYTSKSFLIGVPLREWNLSYTDQKNRHLILVNCQRETCPGRVCFLYLFVQLDLLSQICNNWTCEKREKRTETNHSKAKCNCLWLEKYQKQQKTYTQIRRAFYDEICKGSIDDLRPW